MKIVPPALASHIASEVTTLATCWKLSLKDGDMLGFTDHDCDIVVEEFTYKAQGGITPSMVESSASLGLDHMSIEGVIDSELILLEEIIAGRFDFAELDVFIVNYADPSQGKLPLKKGWLGEVRLVGSQFVAEVRGYGERAKAITGDLYMPSCRVKFGDNRCKLNLEEFTVSGTVTSVTSSHVLGDTARTEEAGYFTGGQISFTSGLNNGKSMEVKEYSPGTIILVLPMPCPVEVGDSYSMIAGCDKSFATCKSRFSNAINFRGEPHIPGMDRMLKTANF